MNDSLGILSSGVNFALPLVHFMTNFELQLQKPTKFFSFFWLQFVRMKSTKKLYPRLLFTFLFLEKLANIVFLFPLTSVLKIQLNSCISNSCNSKNHLNRTNSSVLSEFNSKPLQENSFNSNSHNSKNHLNRTNFWSPGRIFHRVIQIRILVSESNFFILWYSTVVGSNVSIRIP